MGEVKRYEARIKVEGAYFAEAANGDYVLHSDYARLERDHAAAQAELTRLRAVDKAAKHVIYADEKGRITDFMPALRALAEACGRRG